LSFASDISLKVCSASIGILLSSSSDRSFSDVVDEVAGEVLGEFIGEDVVEDGVADA
jgi:hypothetical protein